MKPLLIFCFLFSIVSAHAADPVMKCYGKDSAELNDWKDLLENRFVQFQSGPDLETKALLTFSAAKTGDYFFSSVQVNGYTDGEYDQFCHYGDRRFVFGANEKIYREYRIANGKLLYSTTKFSDATQPPVMASYEIYFVDEALRCTDKVPNEFQGLIGTWQGKLPRAFGSGSWYARGYELSGDMTLQEVEGKLQLSFSARQWIWPDFGGAKTGDGTPLDGSMTAKICTHWKRNFIELPFSLGRLEFRLDGNSLQLGGGAYGVDDISGREIIDWKKYGLALTKKQ